MLSPSGNIYDQAPRGMTAGEQFTPLIVGAGIKVERIVSTGQASPPSFWYDQSWAEWVLLLSGEAGLLLEGETAPRHLKTGDYLLIPAHRRHRVEWTDANSPTIWLAIHFEPSSRGDA
jgi:cupin 2 domain-containing protein